MLRATKLIYFFYRINFTAAGEQLNQLQDTLANLPATASRPVLIDNTLEFSIGGDSSLEVVNVNASLLLRARDVSITNNNGTFNDNTTIVFNVFGTPCGLENIGLQGLERFRNNIIWNFVDCQQLRLRSVAVQGTVIAPEADVTNPVGMSCYSLSFSRIIITNVTHWLL